MADSLWLNNKFQTETRQMAGFFMRVNKGEKSEQEKV